MNAIDPLFERFEAYGKIQIELIQYKAIEKMTEIMSSLMTNSIVGVFIVVFFLFFNLSLSFWLGEILERTYFGFAAVAIFYGLIGLIIHLFMRDSLKKSIGSYIVSNSIKEQINLHE